MITRDQALTEDTFHTRRPGYTPHPRYRGRACISWRRNGKTQTWKTRPEDYRTPVKHGLFAYGNVTPNTAAHFWVPSECPYCKEGAV